jgi:hypothetical protein
VGLVFTGFAPPAMLWKVRVVKESGEKDGTQALPPTNAK